MGTVAVIGLGNVLMGDEGIGVHLVRHLAARQLLPQGVEIVEAGSAGMRLLHLLVGRDWIVFVDGAYMGLAPGTLRQFRPEDVRSCKGLAGFSLHEGDLLSILDVSRRLGECPARIDIFGIEPGVVASGESLSATLSAQLDAYAQTIAAHMRGEGCPA